MIFFTCDGIIRGTSCIKLVHRWLDQNSCKSSVIRRFHYFPSHDVFKDVPWSLESIWTPLTNALWMIHHILSVLRPWTSDTLLGRRTVINACPPNFPCSPSMQPKGAFVSEHGLPLLWYSMLVFLLWIVPATALILFCVVSLFELFLFLFIASVVRGFYFPSQPVKSRFIWRQCCVVVWPPRFLGLSASSTEQQLL